MILFDTDVCVEILRGNQKILARRKQTIEDVAISFMSVSELFYGAAKSRNSAKNRNLVENFVLTLCVLDSNMHIVKKFGEIKASLTKSRNILPDADIFIAATSMVYCSKLITGNTNHFERIPKLIIENWIR